MMQTRAGFSLLEVIIALTVISLVFVGVAGLVNKNLQTNFINQSALTAHYLAQQNLEIARNIRDSGWMQNFDFSSDTSGLWGGETLSTLGSESKYLQLHIENDSSVPWKLVATENDFEANRLYKESNADGRISYTYSDSGDISNLSSWLEVEVLENIELSDYEGLSSLKLTSVVKYKVGSRISEVRYTTVLTDWKQGPL